MRVRVVDNSRIGTFAGTGIGVSFDGHVWLLFVLFQLACGTRRGRNLGTKKKRVVSDALIAKML